MISSKAVLSRVTFSFSVLVFSSCASDPTKISYHSKVYATQAACESESKLPCLSECLHQTETLQWSPDQKDTKYEIVCHKYAWTAKLPSLPDQTTIPVSKKLPIDGIWQILDRKPHMAYKIDRGRMYLYSNYETMKGKVFVKDIQETLDFRKYTCNISFKESFIPGEIEILSDSTLLMRRLTSPDLGVPQTGGTQFRKIKLDDEAWFMSAFKSK